MAHWLQKPDYWGLPLWSVYTPIVHAGDDETLAQAAAAERVALFYGRRFGSSQDNVAQAFARLVDGIDVGSIPNLPFSKELLLQAADASVLPDPSQARICAHAYARWMATHAQG